MKKILLHFVTFFAALAATGLLGEALKLFITLKPLTYILAFAGFYFGGYYQFSWCGKKAKLLDEELNEHFTGE